MHISFHLVSISRGGLYLPACASQWQAGAQPLRHAPSAAGGNKSRPYGKNEDDTAVIVALCLVDQRPLVGTWEAQKYVHISARAAALATSKR